MMGNGDFRPSTAERLQAEFPDAHVYREVTDDGSHGDWIAELHVTLRYSSPTLLRLMVQRVYGLGQVSRPQVDSGCGCASSTPESAGGDRG